MAVLYSLTLLLRVLFSLIYRLIYCRNARSIDHDWKGANKRKIKTGPYLFSISEAATLELCNDVNVTQFQVSHHM